MGDRLEVLREQIAALGGHVGKSPHDESVRDILTLILEEFLYLRDQQAHGKSAAEEFARLTPR